MKIERSNRERLLLTLVSIMLPSATMADIEVYFVGDLPGGLTVSRAVAISHDGSVVAGNSAQDEGTVGFRWTLDDGIQSIGVFHDPDEDTEFTYVRSLSGDGTTVVGNTTGSLAFRWTDQTGIVRLGDLHGGGVGSAAYESSFDGSVVVGTGTVPFLEAEGFRWAAGTGLVGLGDGEGSMTGFSSFAYDVTDDGSLIVGQAEFDIDNRSTPHAVMWTENGIQSLNPEGDDRDSVALYVSADGSAIYGAIAQGISGTHVLWDGEGNMREIGNLGTAWGCSPSGWFLIGESGTGPYVWDEANGFRGLLDILLQHGFELPEGYHIAAATGMSADHRTVCGWGFHDDGPTEGFVIYNFPLPGDVEGDMNGDGWADPLDWKPLQYCAKGPGVHATGICTLADFDRDGDVDLRDIALHYQPQVVQPCTLRTDLTGDCAVDLLDWERIRRCIHNAHDPRDPVRPDCEVGDLDHSGAVDLRDVAIFQRLYAQEAE